MSDQGPALLMMMGHAGTHWSTTTFYVVLPFLAKDLGLSYTQVGQLAAVLNITAFLANSFSGAVVDVLGRRVAVQTMALVCNGVAIAGLGMSGNFLTLAACLAVIGVAVNVWHPAAISFLSQRYPTAKGYAMSVHVLGANLGDAVAPLVIGGLLGVVSWRSVTMLSAIPTLLIAAALAATLLAAERRAIGNGGGQRMPLRGFLTSLGALLRNRVVLALCAMAGFRSITLVGVFTFLPLYLSDVIRMEPVWMGLTLSMMQIGGILSSLVAGAWSDRIGRRRVLMAGVTLTTIAVFAVMLVGDGLLLMAGVSLLGFALFGVRAVMQSWMVEVVPPNMGGTGTSLMFGTQSAMGTLAPLIGGVIADQWGLPAVFYMLAATILVANVIVVLMPRDAEHRLP
jgi:MFS family permease